MKKRLLILSAVLQIFCAAALAQGVDSAKLKELEGKVKEDPNNIELLMDLGRMRFAASRGGDSILFDSAQESFEQALKLRADEPRALVWHGKLLTMRSGRLFQAGKMDEAQGFLTKGFAEMDRGIGGSPGDAALRRLRGETNMRVPEFLGRTALGVEDLDIVVNDPSFDKISPGERAQISLLLGTGYSRLRKLDQARQMWRRAIAEAPQSKSAAEAKKLLDRSESTVSTAVPGRLDRLTEIPDDVGPIMAVASIGFKQGFDPNSLGDKDSNEMLDALKTSKGFMGMRLLQSQDSPPMFVIISWWKNRAALVDWYYNPAHQKMIKGFNIGSGDGSAQSSPPVKDAISHIGLQFYAPLRAGLTIGESFGPRRKPVE